ncbi:MAG: AAA family ATPase [Ignisphaera sp.]
MNSSKVIITDKQICLKVESAVRLKIRRLGPISDSDIELGDITLFMGSPNTGKSYTLRAIYAKLFPLDNYALEVVKKELFERLRRYYEEILFREASDDILKIFKTLVKILLVALLSDENSSDIKLDELLLKVINRSGLKGYSKHEGEILIVNLESPTISTSISIDFLKEAFHDTIYQLTTGLIPVADLNSVTLEPLELTEISIADIVGMSKGTLEQEVTIPAIHMAPHFLDFEYLLYDIVRMLKYHEEPALSRLILTLRYSPPFRRIVERIKANIKLNTEPHPNNIELLSTITFDLYLNTHALMSRKKPIDVTLDDIEKALDNVFKDHRIRRRSISLLNASIATSIGNVLADTLITNISELFKSHIELNGLRFIPYGRSLIIQGIEKTSREVFERPRSFYELIEDFYPINLASYAYWTSKGRSLVLEGKLNELHVKLLRIAKPLLEGEVLADVRGLMYRDWRGSNVELHMSSALVEEVSGLLLALLSIDRNAIVLIEEPEAQLHPAAQIAMALFIASLPKLCGCKVVASTHSDLLAITLSQLATQKPSKDAVEVLLNKLLPHVKDGIDELAAAVAESVQDLDLRIYEFLREGKIRSVDPQTVLREEVPGITRVIDTLTDWYLWLGASEKQ